MIAFLAAAFATGFTFPIAVVASFCASSTAMLVVALSILVVAAVAASLALAIAAVFSSSVKFGFALIASALALRAASIAALASAFFETTGLWLAIAVVPLFWASFNASLVVTFASLIAVNAFSLSAFTLATAAAFSSSVAFGVELIAEIFSVAAVFTASIAGCLSKVTNSDNGFLSVDPSVYVTTNSLLAFLVIDWIFVSWLSTDWPRLLNKFLSGFVVEYSSFTFSLIFSNSLSVTAEGFSTLTLSASVGAFTSYFLVCAFNTRVNAPGSVAYEFPTAVFSIIASSRSVAVA